MCITIVNTRNVSHTGFLAFKVVRYNGHPYYDGLSESEQSRTSFYAPWSREPQRENGDKEGVFLGSGTTHYYTRGINIDDKGIGFFLFTDIKQAMDVKYRSDYIFPDRKSSILPCWVSPRQEALWGVDLDGNDTVVVRTIEVLC